MPQQPADEAREQRIQLEIIGDAYGPEEQASGWYHYLNETLHFPFLACCLAERAISPLRINDEVEILGMAPEEECHHEMFVTTPWEHHRTLAVPLAQLAGIAVDEATAQAIEDWRYWVARGYDL